MKTCAREQFIHIITDFFVLIVTGSGSFVAHYPCSENLTVFLVEICQFFNADVSAAHLSKFDRFEIVKSVNRCLERPKNIY
jgi:hypothetical protein